MKFTGARPGIDIMLCDCKSVLKIKGGHYGRAVIRKDFNKVILNNP
jgi:hypothetical protein